MEEIVQQRVAQWLNSPISEEAKQEILVLQKPENRTELLESFYKTLEFGTGGLRGLMGIGSNRMNIYTVGMATQGLANYINACFPKEENAVVVAYDSRNNSKLLAQTTANVFSANGIKVYLFQELRPTPELSFAIRHFGCKSGVVITASHNPKEYNGYKAYWTDGAQLTPPHDKNVIAEVDRIKGIEEVKFNPVPENIISLSGEIDTLYLEAIKGLSVNPELVKKHNDIRIVYSSIHGTGITLVPQALKNLGFTNVSIVEAQAQPDGNFPTVVYPNPEEKEALKMALDLGKKVDADLVMATDPDTDRVGIAIKNPQGQFQLLNGNQTGTLIIYYLLKSHKKAQRLLPTDYMVKTIVTTDLWEKISQGFGVDCYNTLTGFKYIASLIREWEGKRRFLVGGEESYGYMITDFVRDKDAVAACAIIAEVMAYAREEKITPFEMLLDIYKQFGFYKEDLISLTKKGMSGVAEINQMMKDLRENPPQMLAGSPVVWMHDYQKGQSLHVPSKEEKVLNFPSSNVLQFETADGTKVSARPSGTEPKIKFYFSVNAPLPDTKAYAAVEKQLDEKIQRIIADMRLKA
ncbi:phospho-sugar mutase [Cytophagales bacterium LB-30]|uniref:Phospho-sugar mutase n=1 Tax=Shiella aurantiaca TaxID=3058365 RepID=A0ABT8F4V3_9BACT|nr:phospho-sugar mutase [Shiella aurantiaca]MDN4165279.1 phospho-sugar mutase [Shiella aurantiaca]